jgi:hypothetical protein
MFVSHQAESLKRRIPSAIERDDIPWSTRAVQDMHSLPFYGTSAALRAVEAIMGADLVSA